MVTKILYIASSDVNSFSGGGMVNRVLWQTLDKIIPDKVHVLIPSTEKNDENVHFFYIPYLSKWRKFTHIMQGKIHRYTPWVLDFVDQHPNEYSHCFVNCGLFGDLVEGLQQRRIKVCTIHHNFEKKYQMDNKRPCTLGGITSAFVKSNESRAYRFSDMNLFLTQFDADQLHMAYGESKGNNHVIGIFEKTDEGLVPSVINPLLNNRLVISGGLDSVQSVEGIRLFSQECLPILTQYFHDDFDLLLAGRNPKPSILKLQKDCPNIRVKANPTDMLTTIQEGGIYICPVSSGSGIKTRILDGLKLGMPILTHRVSAQGYDALWDRPWFQIYDDEDTFQKGLDMIVSTIQSNPALRQEIVSAYQQLFSFEKGQERYVAAIKQFLDE